MRTVAAGRGCYWKISYGTVAISWSQTLNQARLWLGKVIPTLQTITGVNILPINGGCMLYFFVTDKWRILTKLLTLITWQNAKKWFLTTTYMITNHNQPLWLESVHGRDRGPRLLLSLLSKYGNPIIIQVDCKINYDAKQIRSKDGCPNLIHVSTYKACVWSHYFFISMVAQNHCKRMNDRCRSF